MRTWYGAPAYFVLGAVHAIVFWMTISVLTPFILLVAFFNERRRLLHDILLGTVVINNAARASLFAGRHARRGRAIMALTKPEGRAMLKVNRGPSEGVT